MDGSMLDRGCRPPRRELSFFFVRRKTVGKTCQSASAMDGRSESVEIWGSWGWSRSLMLSTAFACCACPWEIFFERIGRHPLPSRCTWDGVAQGLKSWEASLCPPGVPGAEWPRVWSFGRHPLPSRCTCVRIKIDCKSHKYFSFQMWRPQTKPAGQNPQERTKSRKNRELGGQQLPAQLRIRGQKGSLSPVSSSKAPDFNQSLNCHQIKFTNQRSLDKTSILLEFLIDLLIYW